MQNDIDSAGARSKNPIIANGKRQQVISKWLGTEVKYRSPVDSKQSPKDVDSSKASGPVKL